VLEASAKTAISAALALGDLSNRFSFRSFGNDGE
jgi:hypothetical protein